MLHSELFPLVKWLFKLQKKICSVLIERFRGKIFDENPNKLEADWQPTWEVIIFSRVHISAKLESDVCQPVTADGFHPGFYNRLLDI